MERKKEKKAGSGGKRDGRKREEKGEAWNSSESRKAMSEETEKPKTEQKEEQKNIAQWTEIDTLNT